MGNEVGDGHKGSHSHGRPHICGSDFQCLKGLSFSKFGGAETKHLRVQGMSVNSDLLFQASTRISNPFVLCTLISSRTRQLMMSANGNLCGMQLVQRALNELLAGVLEFEMPMEKEPKSEAPTRY